MQDNQKQKRRYTNSFVNFDRVSVSKDKRRILIFIGKMVISLNIALVRAILKNLDGNHQAEEMA